MHSDVKLSDASVFSTLGQSYHCCIKIEEHHVTNQRTTSRAQLMNRKRQKASDSCFKADALKVKPSMQFGYKASHLTQPEHIARCCPSFQCHKCHACDAKRMWMSPSPTPCHACHATGGWMSWMSPSPTPATQLERRCHQAPRLPRKVPQRHRRPVGPKRATGSSPVP